jgi:hypothetical protein
LGPFGRAQAPEPELFFAGALPNGRAKQLSARSCCKTLPLARWGGKEPKNVAPPAPPAAPPSLFPFALEAVAGSREVSLAVAERGRSCRGSSSMDGGGATWWRRLHRLRGRPPPEREPPQRRLSRWSS